MTKPKLSVDASDDPVRQALRPVEAASNASAVASPARLLRHHLQISFASEPYVPKWPLPARVAIIFGGAAASWAIILRLASAII